MRASVCNIILTEAPADKNVNVLLFNTNDQTDIRKNARDRIEAFVVPSARAEWGMLGEGQRSVTASSNSPIPVTGTSNSLKAQNHHGY